MKAMTSRIVKKLVITNILVLTCILFGCATHPSLPIRDQIDTKSRGYIKTRDRFSRRELAVKVWPLIDIAAVGDIMLGSWLTDVLNARGHSYPFDSTRSFLNCDFAIANLEAPFTDAGTKFKKKYNFKVPGTFADGIQSAGFDIVTLANNHTLDYGCEGLLNTMTTLDSLEIAYCGAGKDLNEACSPTIIEHFGTRVAFVGFSMTFPEEFWASDTSCGTCYPEGNSLAQIIRDCENLADITVASFHWGAERFRYPKDYQVAYAHIAIDNGADLVLGHHPHVLQGLEIYKNRLIAYSLGNFVFGSYGNYVQNSAILQVNLTPAGMLSAQIIPILVYNAEVEFQPKILRNDQKMQVIRELNELSQGLNNGKTIIDDDGSICKETINRQL